LFHQSKMHEISVPLPLLGGADEVIEVFVSAINVG